MLSTVKWCCNYWHIASNLDTTRDTHLLALRLQVVPHKWLKQPFCRWIRINPRSMQRVNKVFLIKELGFVTKHIQSSRHQSQYQGDRKSHLQSERVLRAQVTWMRRQIVALCSRMASEWASTRSWFKSRTKRAGTCQTTSSTRAREETQLLLTMLARMGMQITEGLCLRTSIQTRTSSYKRTRVSRTASAVSVLHRCPIRSDPQSRKMPSRWIMTLKIEVRKPGEVPKKRSPLRWVNLIWRWLVA